MSTTLLVKTRSALAVIFFLVSLTGCETGQLRNVDSPPAQAMSLGASFSVVGAAIYVPNQNLGAPIAAGRGMQVFAALEADGCIVPDPLAGDSTGLVHTWTSTKAYYDYIKSDTKLDASVTNSAVLSSTLNVASGRSIDRTTEIAGAVYEYNAYKQLFSLAVDCQTGRDGKGRLIGDLLAAFNALPYPVGSPVQARSWDAYQQFLEGYGSHYVTEVKAGARYRSYTFKKAYSEINESQLTIAACVSAQGLPTEAGEVSVKGCENIDKKKSESINIADYTNKSTAYGGQQRIRDRLAAGDKVTPELLSQFSATADVAQDGVQYQVEPLWKLLASRATTDKQSNQARTLRAYFEGFIALNCNQVHGCGCNNIMDPKGKVLLRRFIQTDVDNAEYRCERPAMGCRNDDDCHYKYGVTVGNYCQCYGDHCVNQDIDGISSVVNHKAIGGVNTGPNKSCKYKLGSGCVCQRPAKDASWEAIWTGPAYP